MNGSDQVGNEQGYKGFHEEIFHAQEDFSPALNGIEGEGI